MHIRQLLIGLTIGALGAATAFAHAAGPDPGLSGAPGDSTCVACHGGSPNTGPGKVSLAFANGLTYTAGQTQVVTVTVEDPSARRWGFEASPRLASDAANSGAGTLATVDGNTQLLPNRGTVQWICHTIAGTRKGTTGPVSFQFNWTAPASDVGDVTFYVAANAANGNGAPTGDLIYTTQATLKPAAQGGVDNPSIVAGGIVNGASLAAGPISPGSWFTIFGASLATNARDWDPSHEIVEDKLPTSLDGTSVTVNGRPAAVSYISANQINAQAPDDDTTGPVNVVVTRNGAQSDPMQVTLQRSAPALFLFSPQNRKFAAATFGAGTTFTYIAPSGMFGSGASSRPAHPGEVISLYGTGFGPTNPQVPAGRVFGGAAPLIDTTTATIGGIAAPVSFAGLSGAGLVQINVQIPDGVADGDQPLVVSVGGQKVQDNIFVSVQR